MLWKYRTCCYFYEVDLYTNHIVLFFWPAGYSSPCHDPLSNNFCFFHFPFSQILIVAAVPLAIFLLLSCFDNVTTSLERGVVTCSVCQGHSAALPMPCPPWGEAALSGTGNLPLSLVVWVDPNRCAFRSVHSVRLPHTDISCRHCLSLAPKILW